jgi:glycosyltransferase involved in cell wall biosynthesis
VDISVVIPTYNRRSALEITLNGLREQDSDVSFEVIVVDDGSSDDTASKVFELQESFPVPLHYFHQENRGQSTARNLGARNAAGDYLLFLGDDIEPVPAFLAEHLEKHRNAHPSGPDSSKIVVIGYTTWPDHYRKNRFLEFIGERGWQFGFSIIENPEDVPFNFFYTSNISLPRKFFIESGGFDEDFREYGWEDIELSARLKKVGMRIVYCSKAKAFHHHPTTISSFIQRQRKVGLSALPFLEKHPNLREFLGIDHNPDYSMLDHIKMRILTVACKLTENMSWPDFSRYYPDILTFYYMQGLTEGKKRLVLSADVRNTIPGAIKT